MVISIGFVCFDYVPTLYEIIDLTIKTIKNIKRTEDRGPARNGQKRTAVPGPRSYPKKGPSVPVSVLKKDRGPGPRSKRTAVLPTYDHYHGCMI